MNCDVNCPNILNHDALNPIVNYYTCNCDTTAPNNYFWNPIALECNVDCSSVIGSDDTVIQDYPCHCANNWIWNDAVRQCYINCDAIPNAVTQTPASQTLCDCTTGTWSTTSFSCV